MEYRILVVYVIMVSLAMNGTKISTRHLLTNKYINKISC